MALNSTWYCLSSSIGGCAPYVSSFGMFKSSTNIIIRFPAGAPMRTTQVVTFEDTVLTECFCTLAAVHV